MHRYEYKQARLWREKLKLSPGQLADATGYSELAIYWFERGETPENRNAKSGNANDRKIKPHVWQRYKMCCAGVAACRERKFNW